MLAAHQPSDLRGAVGDRRHRQVPARGVEAAQVTMAGGGADDVRGDDQPRALHESSVEGVAEVDGRELRIHAAEVAQRRKAIAQILAGEAEPLQRLGRRGLERLLSQIGGVHRQVDVSVDEPRTDRALR